MNYDMLKQALPKIKEQLERLFTKALSEIQGPFIQLLTNLSGEDGETWFKELKKFLRKEPCWFGFKSEFLRYLGFAILPAATKKFVVKNYFIVYDTRPGPRLMLDLDQNFRDWFLDKVEEAQPKKILYYYETFWTEANISIINEFGGESVAETTLGDIYRMMSFQASGRSGKLDVKGYGNIFYVRDVNNCLRVVRVKCGGSTWHLKAQAINGNVIGAFWRIFARGFMKHPIS